MHIILLSGGSGKRLWPLSNDVHSKQFIKLFRNQSGEYESMVQRVYRQIKQAIPGAQITIATSKKQRSATINQLSDQVSICLEPCRRDTFPAIALAAAYLRDVQGVPEDEAIVVCPVDPYVQDSYYNSIGDMEQLILQGSANLTLLGITPTYPSEKYGYIIPEFNAPLAPVREFKEKPSTDVAREYLRMGALWNAGVFGFRLSYLLEKARTLVGFNGYQELLARYDQLKAISFDYAVVEKESSIQVQTYTGQWRDVGTWNMLTEVMDEKIIGHAMMDTTCHNTHVVNKLDIPILCMGLNNCIVAASGDGILVSDKFQSGYMKPYVDQLNTQARFAEKSWGEFQVLDESPGCLTVKLTLRAGARMNYHSHELRDEVWTVLSGQGRTTIDGVEAPLRTGDTVTIHAGHLHTLMADTDMKVIEVQIGNEITGEDMIEYDQE